MRGAFVRRRQLIAAGSTGLDHEAFARRLCRS